MREGARVSYVGEDDGLAVGDQGRVLSASGAASHVRWTTGARTGEIVLVNDLDLVANRKPEVTNDGLDAASLVTLAVRDTFDATGPVGLLNALNEEGHLATFSIYAEQALEFIAAAIRTDASMAEVLANLETEEQSAFISFTASILLRDAFGQDI